MTFDPFAASIFRDNGWHPFSGETRDVIDPASLETVGRIAVTDVETCEAVAQRAHAVQADWKRLDAKSRAAALHRIADAIEGADHEAVAVLMVREMGKPFPEALGEVANVAPVFRYYAEMARDDAGKIAGTTQSGSFQYARYEPYGVSVHIMPFNFPILLMAWTVAASLAAGNAVIIKPAEATSLSTLAFMTHFASLADGLVSCVTGGPDTGAALIASDHTHAVAVTGGVETGRRVGVACAERMKPCTIEAGGNDAFIVMPSAPVDASAAAAVTAAFHLSGQVCTSAERIYVHEEVHDGFLERFVARTKALRIGSGLTESEIGPVVSEAARAKVMRIVDDAVAKGAVAACGGRIPPAFNTGWFYEPTILTGVTPDMAITREEVFGPVAAVTKVASLDEAIERSNASHFGLGASIMTHDLAEAMRAADEIEAGMVWINNPLIDNDALPFGGFKLSGLGRELGRQGLDAFRQAKMVIMDPTAKIQDWWYPYPKDWFYSGKGRTFS